MFKAHNGDNGFAQAPIDVRGVDERYELEEPTKRVLVAEKWQGTAEDRRDMQVLGRVQELRRNFGFTSIVGFGSTLICTWEVVLATLSSSLTNGGTAGLFWTYIIVALGFLLVYCSLAEMASMAPTSGGQYHWVSEFSPRSCQKYLSYLTGWLCFTGWQSGLTGISFLAGTIIQGLIVINDESYVYQNWHGTLLVIGITAFAVFFNTFLAKRLPLVEGLVLVLHVLGLFAIIIPLWVLAPRNNAKAAFTQFTNNGGWPTTGTSVMVGLYPIIVSLLGFDSAVHMSEEVKDAARTLPRSIVWSHILNAVLGLLVVITVIFTWGDMAEIAKTPTFYPFIQIFYNTTKNTAGTDIMVAIIIITLTASCTAVTATASRQIWSFARDYGTPFSSVVARVTPGWNIPLNAVLISLAVTALLALINIGSSAALNAILSLNIGSLLTSYMLCIGCVLLKRFRGEPLPIARWSLGRFGMIINLLSLCFLFPIWVFSFFPSVNPPEPVSMNWGVLMYGFIILFSTVYYLLVGRHRYISPADRVRRDFQRDFQ